MKTRPRDVFVRRLDQLLTKGRAKLVSERSGVSETTLSNWRRGKVRVNPELETLEKIADALGVSAGYLISEEAFERAQEREQLVALVSSSTRTRELAEAVLARRLQDEKDKS